MENPRVLEVIALRSGPAYQAAEALRRKKFGGAKGAKQISAKPGSAEYAALRLLIGTWDAIAHQILALPDRERVPFYETNPIGYMWKLLEPAIIQIRKEVGKQYAKRFEDLYKAYAAWLAQQPADYQTAADNGLSAQFG